MSAQDYEEIDRIEDANGLVAVITRHKTRLGKFSVALYQIFHRGNGEPDKTIWLDSERLPHARTVLEAAQTRIKKLLDGMREVSRGNLTPSTNKIRSR